ncbi:MAG: heme o synthase [Planctomycetes bacterium]|nr:heme o synthase [Planctomycetota bacterium]
MSRLTTAAEIAALADARTRRAWLVRAADYVELTKPRIVAMELVTVIVAAHLASPWGVDRVVLLATVFGAGLVAASAGALNQWWERATDARMPRTANRPLPAGRLTSRRVLLFGAATLIGGLTALAVGANLAAAGMALATWLIYVLAYTPMKTRTPLNTAVGAASGALPILIGWTATGAAIDVRALSLVAVMFLWQFPHFMAIAWLYRTDYARAGQRMLTVVDPTGLRAGAQAVVAALSLIPVSLVPALGPQAGSPVVYFGWALVLGAFQVAAATMFLLDRNDRTARRLLRASLAYLICWMGLLLMVAI